MKTITRITFTLLVAVILCSCNEVNIPEKEDSFRVRNGYAKLIIKEVDSCEYLYGEWGNATVLTHKGNCKFCTERSKKN